MSAANRTAWRALLGDAAVEGRSVDGRGVRPLLWSRRLGFPPRGLTGHADAGGIPPPP